ncbi:TetR/AcrR family transcriptional regulator [Novosphingobium kaempferiae]|uniref:TetR/AcrR family transcriptional regulator n=1 Tax=Novosphingobium kaempferiae TaxID=2896849 RepID=UPI001E4BC29C|nr:TetR/AcrR family transcriptional regulator [Novosphingobium kaempferiae]
MTEKAVRRGRPGQADRRDVILAAAARRFAEFGFEATTVRQIADDVNILSGSLYHHFATKEEMLDSIVRDAALDQRERAVRIASADADAETRFVTLIAEELAALAGRIEAYAIIFNERKFFRRSPDFLYLMKARKEAFEAWRGVLDDGMAAGLFHPGIDSYLTISTILRMLNSGADWYRHEDGSPLDAMADYSLDALTTFYAGFALRSVRAPGRAGEPIPSALFSPALTPPR